MRTILIFFLILCFKQLVSQNQNDNWVINSNGSLLNFNSCRVSILKDSLQKYLMFEGQSAISDESTGSLLFYTNGVNVYDRTFNIMSNGEDIGVSNSYTQTLIVKKPKSDKLFYIIMPDLQAGLAYNANNKRATQGIHFSLIDISLNGGKGGVISKYNGIKDSGNCEMLMGARHKNGVDYWLISHEFGTNNFITFLIDSNGIGSPILTSIGPIINTPQPGIPGKSNFDAIGELKVSPDNTKVAFTTFYNGITCLVDFNNSTGKFSNPIQLFIEGGGYGVSFSPSSKKLYITGIDTSINDKKGKIYQYDLQANNIQNSRQTIYFDSTGMFRSLKLGQDAKIYVSRGIANCTGVIDSPNLLGN